VEKKSETLENFSKTSEKKTETLENISETPENSPPNSHGFTFN
jgi:hypothetical protein